MWRAYAAGVGAAVLVVFVVVFVVVVVVVVVVDDVEMMMCQCCEWEAKSVQQQGSGYPVLICS